VSAETHFDARILSSFAVADRGPYVEISIIQGEVKNGDYVRLRLEGSKSQIFKVHAVDFLDRVRHGARTGTVALGLPELGEMLVVVGSHVRGVYPCPCCRLLTVSAPAGFEICPICSWEDDGQGDADADVVRGGPNGDLSLTEARATFAGNGPRGRAPFDDERPR
jgi:hypothetical protein